MMGRFSKVDHDMLIAVDEPTKAIMQRLEYGVIYDTEVLLDQNDDWLRRKVFATIGSIAKIMFLEPDQLRARLLFETGHYKLLGVTDKKQPIINVQSMSRRGMSDRDLRAFWREAEQVIRERIVPTLDEQSQHMVLAHLEAR